MSAFAAVAPVNALSTAPISMQLGGVAAPVAAPASGFGQLLMNGIQSMNTKLDSADALVRRFAIDDSVPVHQVTAALEEARLSVELAMQVRSRLVEGYRDLMTMQL